MKNKKSIIVSWDQSELAEDQAELLLGDEAGEGMTKDEALDSVFMDQGFWEDQWEYMLESLQEVLTNKNPDGYWKVSVKGFGWRNLDGYKTFHAKNAEEFLQEILPDTDCTFYIHNDKNGLAIHNYHHDSPTGEWYYIKPMAQSRFEAHA